MPTTEYGVDQFFQNSGTSPKMVYDVAGTLGWSPHNTILQSENLQASWTFIGATAPTATFLLPDTGNTSHRVMATNTTAVIGDTWTHSAIVSAGGYSKVGFLEAGTNFVDVAFDLNAGTKIYQGTVGNGTITSLGGGLYLITTTIVVATASFRVYLYVLPDSYTTGAFPVWVPDGVKGINIFRSQANRGSVPTAYLPTTTAARFGLALDYDPVTHAARGLLCEPAATNLQKGTATLADAAIWLISAATMPSAGVAPTGGAAFALTEDTATAGHSTIQVNGQGALLSAGTVYTLSGYVKANGRTRFRLFGGVAFTNFVVFFDLTTGTFDNVSGGIAPSFRINPAGNGWYRWEATDQAATTQARPSFDLCSGGTNVNYAGNGTSGVYIWNHMQVETGTVATSPIPTFAASATRAADQYNITPASIGYSATAGSWWIEHYPLNISASNPRMWLNAAGTAYLGVSAANIYLMNDGTSLNKTVGTLMNGSPHKVAMAFQSADRAITGDGLAIATDTGQTTNFLSPGASIIFGGTGGTVTHGYFRKLRYVPRRKTNTELVTETT